MTQTLDRPTLAPTGSDFIEAHLYNMQQLGICYANYEALVEAVNAREE